MRLRFNPHRLIVLMQSPWQPPYLEEPETFRFIVCASFFKERSDLAALEKKPPQKYSHTTYEDCAFL